ncbi:unnamed protein product, partial [Amoebophrya sp. A25]
PAFENKDNHQPNLHHIISSCASCCRRFKEKGVISGTPMAENYMYFNREAAGVLSKQFKDPSCKSFRDLKRFLDSIKDFSHFKFS